MLFAVDVEEGSSVSAEILLQQLTSVNCTTLEHVHRKCFDKLANISSTCGSRRNSQRRILSNHVHIGLLNNIFLVLGDQTICIGESAPLISSVIARIVETRMVNRDLSVSEINDLLTVELDHTTSIFPSVDGISYWVAICYLNRTQSIISSKCATCQTFILDLSRTYFFKVEEVSVDTISRIKNLSWCDSSLGNVIQDNVSVSQGDQTFKDHTEEGRTFVNDQSINNITNSCSTDSSFSQSIINFILVSVDNITLNSFVDSSRFTIIRINILRVKVEIDLCLLQVVQDRRRCLKVNSNNFTLSTRSKTSEHITFDEGSPLTTYASRTLQVDASDWISVRGDVSNTSSNVR